MSNRESGGALPAAIVLQLILLLVGLQIALAASTLRLAVARTGALVESERLAEAAVSVAGEAESSELLAALAGNGNLDVDLAPLEHAADVESVRILDDEDGDGDLQQDANGRAFLVARTGRVPFPGTQPSRAMLTREVLIGSRLPMPAALVDCGAGPGLCAGEDGCEVPPASVVSADTAALAVPAGQMDELQLKFFVLGREVLRSAHQRCAEGICTDMDDRLLRAAASQVVQLLEVDPESVVDLDLGGVLLMVDGLLDLTGLEAGPGTFPWWDGTWRGVSDRAVLASAVIALSLPGDHVPSLAGHPFLEAFRGTQEWTDDAGLCRRLPVYLQAALLRADALESAGVAPPPEESLEVISAPRRIGSGELLAGQGVLVIQDILTVMEGGQLRWRGSVVLDGGSLVGNGSMEIQGSVLVMPGSSEDSMNLSMARLHLQADLNAHAQAWESAGNILLSAWFGPDER
jgi:hypothetical protein